LILKRFEGVAPYWHMLMRKSDAKTLSRFGSTLFIPRSGRRLRHISAGMYRLQFDISSMSIMLVASWNSHLDVIQYFCFNGEQ
jgi:uncharacterized membrane protein YpjA